MNETFTVLFVAILCGVALKLYLAVKHPQVYEKMEEMDRARNRRVANGAMKLGEFAWKIRSGRK